MNPTFRTLISIILIFSIIVTCSPVALSAPSQPRHLSPQSTFNEEEPLQFIIDHCNEIPLEDKDEILKKTDSVLFFKIMSTAVYQAIYLHHTYTHILPDNRRNRINIPEMLAEVFLDWGKEYIRLSAVYEPDSQLSLDDLFNSDRNRMELYEFKIIKNQYFIRLKAFSKNYFIIYPVITHPSGKTNDLQYVFDSALLNPNHLYTETDYRTKKKNAASPNSVQLTTSRNFVKPEPIPQIALSSPPTFDSISKALQTLPERDATHHQTKTSRHQQKRSSFLETITWKQAVILLLLSAAIGILVGIISYWLDFAHINAFIGFFKSFLANKQIMLILGMLIPVFGTMIIQGNPVDPTTEVSIKGPFLEIHSDSGEERKQTVTILEDPMQYLNSFSLCSDKTTVKLPIGNFFTDITGNDTIPDNALLRSLALHHSVMKEQKYKNNSMKLMIADMVFYSFIRSSIPEEECDITSLTHEYPYIAFLEKSRNLPVAKIPGAAHQYQHHLMAGTPAKNKDLVIFAHKLFGFSYIAQGRSRFDYGNWSDALICFKTALEGKKEKGESELSAFTGLTQLSIHKTSSDFPVLTETRITAKTILRLLDIRDRLKESENYLLELKAKYPLNYAIRCLYAESLILNDKTNEATAELDDIGKCNITTFPDIARLRGKIALLTGEGNPLVFYYRSVEHLLSKIDTYGHLYGTSFLDLIADDLGANYPKSEVLSELSKYLSCIVEQNKFVPLLISNLIIKTHENCESVEDCRDNIGIFEDALSVLTSHPEYTSPLLASTKATILDELQEIYAELGRYEDAIALCEEMAELTAGKPIYGSNYTLIAAYYFKLGQYEKAARYADHAIALDTPSQTSTYMVMAKSGIVQYLESADLNENRLATIAKAFKLVHIAQINAQDDETDIDDDLEEFSILLLQLLSKYDSTQDINSYTALLSYAILYEPCDFTALLYNILQRCYNAPESFPNINLDSIRAILNELLEVYVNPDDDEEEYILSCSRKLLSACTETEVEYDPLQFKEKQKEAVKTHKNKFIFKGLLTEEDIQASDIDLFPYRTEEYLEELTVSKYMQKYPYLSVMHTVRPALDRLLDGEMPEAALDQELKTEHDAEIDTITTTMDTAGGNISSTELSHDEVIFAYRARGVDEAPVAADKLKVWLNTQRTTAMPNKDFFELLNKFALKNHDSLVKAAKELEEYNLSVFCRYAVLTGYPIDDIARFIVSEPKGSQYLNPWNRLETDMWLAFGNYISGNRDNVAQTLDSLLATANTDIPKYGFIIQPQIPNFFRVMGETDRYLRAIDNNANSLDKIEDPDKSRFEIIDRSIEESRAHAQNFGVSEPIINFQEKALSWFLKHQNSHEISKSEMATYIASAIFFLGNSYYSQGLYLKAKSVITDALKITSIKGSFAASIYTILGNIYQVEENLNRSIIYKELTIAELKQDGVDNIEQVKGIHASLFTLHAQKNNIPKALDHYNCAKSANSADPSKLPEYARETIAGIPDERDSFIYERAKNNVFAFLSAGHSEVFNAFSDAREAATESNEISNLAYVLCELIEENPGNAMLINRVISMLHDITIEPKFALVFISMAETEMERINGLKHVTTINDLKELKKIDTLLSNIACPEAVGCRQRMRSDQIAKRQNVAAPVKGRKKNKGKGKGKGKDNRAQLVPCSISEVLELIAFLGTLGGIALPSEAPPPAPPVDPAGDGGQDQTPKPINIGALVNIFTASPYCYAPKQKLLEAAQTAAITSGDELPGIALNVAIEHYTEIHGQKLANAKYRITALINTAHTSQWRKGLLTEVLKYIPIAFLTDEEIRNFVTPHKAKKPKKVIDLLHSEEVASLSKYGLDESETKAAIAATISAIANIDNRAFAANIRELKAEINQVIQKKRRQEAEIKRKEGIAELKGKKNFALLTDEDYDILCPLPPEEDEEQAFALTDPIVKRLQTMNAIRVNLDNNPCYIPEASLITGARTSLSKDNTKITNPAQKADGLILTIETNTFSRQYSLSYSVTAAVLTCAHENHWSLTDTKNIFDYFNTALISEKKILEVLRDNASKQHSAIIAALHKKEAVSFFGVNTVKLGRSEIAQTLVTVRAGITGTPPATLKERRDIVIKQLEAQKQRPAARTRPVAAKPSTATRRPTATPRLAAAATARSAATPLSAAELEPAPESAPETPDPAADPSPEPLATSIENELKVALDSTDNSISFTIMPGLTSDTLPDFFNKHGNKMTSLFQSYFRQGTFKAIPGEAIKLFTIMEHSDPLLVHNLYCELLDCLFEAYKNYQPEKPADTETMPWNDIAAHEINKLAKYSFPVAFELLEEDVINRTIHTTITEEDDSAFSELALFCFTNIANLTAPALKKTTLII